MRAASLLLVCTCLVPISACADPNDLSGGVLITHATGEPIDRYGTYQACERYFTEGWGIQDCESQINTIPAGDYNAYMFFVVAAWDEEKTWCGTEFGIGPEFEGWFYFVDYGPCCPGNFLELPTGGWPGAGAGTSVVITDTPWEGNFLPVYFFAGYGYYEDIIPLDVNPNQVFAGFGNCAWPPETFDAFALGAMGVGLPGVYVCPPAAMAVCCIGEICQIMTEEACADSGGEWHPEHTECVPNPCVPTPSERSSWGSIKVIYR